MSSNERGPSPDFIRSLRFEGVTVLGHNDEHIFDQLSFELPTASTVWLRASNGDGKSQFLRLLAGLDDPAEGHIYFNELNVTEMEFAEFAPIQKRIGYGFEYGGLLSNRTIAQNLMLPFFYHRDLSPEDAQKRVDEMLEVFALTRVRDRRPATCSGSNRKVACVARALITWPELLLLDHPTAGLDECAVRSLQRLIALHKEERGLKHVFIASEDERFMTGLGVCIKLNLSDLRQPPAEVA